MYPSPLCIFPDDQHFAFVWWVCYNWWTSTDKLILTKIHNLHEGSLCCTVYGFWQMDGVTDPSLQYHTEQLHCSKNPPSPPTQPLPTSPWQPLIFLLCLVLTFSECHRVGGTQLIAFSDWLLSPRGGGCLVAESCLTLCNPMDCNFSADGISQARILNRLPFPSSGDLPDPGIEPPVSCIGRQILYHWATREVKASFT